MNQTNGGMERRTFQIEETLRSVRDEVHKVSERVARLEKADEEIYASSTDIANVNTAIERAKATIYAAWGAALVSILVAGSVIVARFWPAG